MSRGKPYRQVRDTDDLDEVLAPGSGPVVLAFGSSCPRPGLAQSFEQVAAQFEDAPVGFFTVDADACPELVEQCRVRSIPTVLFYFDGQVQDALVGRVDAPRLAKRTQALLARHPAQGFFSRLFGMNRARA